MHRIRAVSLEPRNGFTIIELLVAMTVAGVVLMFALPNIDYVGLRVSSSARQAQITMLGAQRLAVLRQHSVVVAFDTAGSRLRVHEDRDSDGLIEAGEQVNYLALEEGVVFSRGAAGAHTIGSAPISFVKRQEGWPAVTFSRSGSAGENGGFYIASGRSQEVGKPSEVRAFEVNRGTGRTVMYEPAGSGWMRSY